MRPAVDGLEGRQLLSATPIVLTPGASDVRVATYRTAAGAKVTIQLHGAGNLNGTNLDAEGDLNLVYGGTSAQSKIYVTVAHGSAPLESVGESDIGIYNYTGIGGQLLGALFAPQLDLVTGGQINMTSGVGRVELRSIGSNTQIHLRDLPQTFLATLTNAPSTTVNINNVNSGSSATGTSAGVTNTINNVTGTATSPGSGTSNGSNSTGNVIANGPTIALGQTTNIPTFITSQTFVNGGGTAPVTIPPGEAAVTPLSQVGTTTPTSYTFAGRTLTYSNDANGGTTLQSATGIFTPTANLISTPNPQNPGPNPQPPGVLFQVGAVIGAGGSIGAGEIYGYDPVINSLVQFNTVNGSVTSIVPVGGTPTGAAGVGLGRIDRQIVVLLARGTTVQVFDASSGAAMGSFSTTSLASLGFNAVDGVAFTGTSTVLSGSTVSIPVQPQGTSDFGIMVAIDVKKSLATGSAVTAGKPFVTENGFSFASDPTGIGETNNVYMFGASPLNLNEVPFRQAAIQTVSNLNSGSPKQTSQLVLPNPSNPQGVTPDVNFGGVVGSGPLTGLGSPLGGFETLLGIDQGVASNGTNFIRLYNPFTLTAVDSLSLQDPDQLVALSETFHPELKGSALIDVQGNVSAFNANSATGMVLNDQGNLNLVQIGTATNSEIVGQPLGHVQIPRRIGNVVLVSSSRSVGTRGGVLIVPALRTLGTLSLPS